MTRAIPAVLSFVIGGLVGTLAGFAATLSALAHRGGYIEFTAWLTEPQFLHGWWPWPLFGGVIAALLYVVAHWPRARA